MKFFHTSLFRQRRISLWLIIFILALSGSVAAETKVCNGDSVVIVLNSYKQGNTLWQQSHDRTTWSNAQGTTYNDSLVLTATNSYFYRAIIKDGTCSPFYSDTVLVIVTACPTPVYCTYKSTCNGNITDSRDNKTYKTVQIGTQCWMAQNLNVGKRIDGIVPQTQFDSVGVNTIEKYCYNDTAAYCTTYGGLYLWGEIMAYGSSVINAPGPRGICPTGWHLPTDNEWKCLEMTLGMSKTDADIGNSGRGTTEGSKLKDTTLWTTGYIVNTNSSGFSALPGGYRNGNGGSFSIPGCYAYFWSAMEDDATLAWGRYMDCANANVGRYSRTKQSFGYGVRCVKD